MGTNCNLVLFFCMWLSEFLSIIYEISFLFSNMCFYLFCQKLFAHIHVVLFWASQFRSIGLCVCFSANTMLFWLSLLCSIIWSQVVWYLQLHSFFSGLLWLFRVFCGFIQIWWFFCSISLKNVIGILVGIAPSPTHPWVRSIL